MGFFTKKEKNNDLKENEEDKVNINNRYLIWIKAGNGDNSDRFIKRFYAIRWVDEQTGIEYLVNKKEKFQEFFPEIEKTEENNVKNLTLEEAQKKLSVIEEKIAQIKKGDNPKNENIKNYEYDKYIAERKIEILKFGLGSFLTYLESGTPLYIYKRVGGFYLPYMWHTKDTHIYLPSQAKTKRAQSIIRNKIEKHFNLVDALSKGIIIMFFVMIAVLFVNMYFAYKNYTWADDKSNLAEMNKYIDNTAKACLDMELKTAQNLISGSKELDKVTKNMVNITSSIIEDRKQEIETQKDNIINLK